MFLAPKASKVSFFRSLTSFATGTGTNDLVPLLSIIPALDFRQSIGGEKKIMDYCDKLAEKGGKRMAEILGTEVMDHNGELLNAMVSASLVGRKAILILLAAGQCPPTSRCSTKRSLEGSPRTVPSDDARTFNRS